MAGHSGEQRTRVRLCAATAAQDVQIMVRAVREMLRSASQFAGTHEQDPELKHDRERDRKTGAVSSVAWRVFAMERKATAERELADLPPCEAAKRRRRGLLPPEISRSPILLGGAVLQDSVYSLDVLPLSGLVVTSTNTGNLRVSAPLSGKLLWEVDAHDGRSRGAMAVVTSRIVATGGWNYTSTGDCLRTWNAETGQPLDEMQVSIDPEVMMTERVRQDVRGVSAIATVDGQRFAVGCCSGDIIVCKHDMGTNLAEIARVAAVDKHDDWILDFSVYGKRLASTSYDTTVAVWDVESCERLALLQGDGNWADCVEMSESLLVTGSRRAPHIRVYSVADGYSCITKAGAVDWVHSGSVTSVKILDSDHIMSASKDQTIAIASVKTNKVVARVELDFAPRCTAVLQDGSIAVSDFGDYLHSNSRVYIIPAPHAAASLLRECGCSRYRATSS